MHTFREDDNVHTYIEQASLLFQDAYICLEGFLEKHLKRGTRACNLFPLGSLVYSTKESKSCLLFVSSKIARKDGEKKCSHSLSLNILHILELLPGATIICNHRQKKNLNCSWGLDAVADCGYFSATMTVRAKQIHLFTLLLHNGNNSTKWTLPRTHLFSLFCDNHCVI